VSRLDSYIRRICAQRDCLNLVAESIAGHDGLILELGLGNGRTFDHLRELFPTQEVFVFERMVAAHPDCIPDAPHLIEGDIRQTLPLALEKWGRRILFVHADLGSGNPRVDEALAAFVATVLPPYLLSQGMVLSDQNLSSGHWDEAELPPRISPGRYFMYRSRTGL